MNMYGNPDIHEIEVPGYMPEPLTIEEPVEMSGPNPAHGDGMADYYDFPDGYNEDDE